jgi:hypothetical protein
MEKVLYDIHVADGYVSYLPSVDSAKKLISPVYKGIYKKFNTDSAQFAQSMDYYYRHPDVLAKMYEKISSRIKTAQNKELERQQKETALLLKKEKADSAKRAKILQKQKADSLKKTDTLQKAKPDSLAKKGKESNKTSPQKQKRSIHRPLIDKKPVQID